MMESSMSHHCSTRHLATLVPPTRGVPLSRGCCDTAPALTRCGLRQQSLGSTKTHRSSQQRRKTAQQCKRIATEVREVLELYKLDLDRVSSLWQQDLVASFPPDCSDESSNRDEGDGSFVDVIVDWSKHGATRSVLERVETGRDVDLNLGNSVEADGGVESMSENLCAEFGRHIVLDLIKRVAAASGREELCGNLCADCGRGLDIDLNMSKRDEADSGLEHFSGDP